MTKQTTTSTGPAPDQPVSPTEGLFQQGLERFREGNYLAAINLWEDLKERGYSNPNLDVYLHAARLERSKKLWYVETTCSDLERLARQFNANGKPSEARSAHQAAELIRGRHYEDAASEIKTMVLANVEDATLHLALARVYCIQGKARNAVIHAERARALALGDAEPYSTLGQILAEIDQHQDSERSFLSAIEINPRFERAWYGLGSLYYSQKRLALAEECVRKALSISPSNLTTLAFLDEIRTELETIEGLILEAQKAVAEHPRWADWHFKLGNLYSQTGSVADALTCYGAALEINPQYAKCRYERAGLLLKEGRHEEALADLKLAEKGIADRDELLLARSKELEAKGALAESAHELWNALRIVPDYASRHIELGKKFHTEGLLEQAAREISFGLSINPEYPDGHHVLGLVQLKQGRPAVAVGSLEEALALNPKFAAAAIALVEALLAAGRPDRAREVLETKARPLATTPELEAQVKALEARLG